MKWSTAWAAPIKIKYLLESSEICSPGNILTVIATFQPMVYGIAQPLFDKNDISPCVLYGLHLDPASAN